MRLVTWFLMKSSLTCSGFIWLIITSEGGRGACVSTFISIAGLIAVGEIVPGLDKSIECWKGKVSSIPEGILSE